jgi:hypothetical protein
VAPERFVVLGLAPARSRWFRDVGQWANAGSLPVEFWKCQSAEELRARLATGRLVSAVLIDAMLPALDRDLVETVVDAGSALLVVDELLGQRDWISLGASGWLPPTFGPTDLVDALGALARPVRRAAEVPGEPTEGIAMSATGHVLAVCGPGGTGASTAAIALAQGVAETGRGRHRPAAAMPKPPVLLVDLCRHAEQTMLHDARDVLAGVQELAEAHRSGYLPVDQIASLCVGVPERGYWLLAGLRRAQSWPAVKPRAFAAGLGALRTAFGTVVADVDADLEGEADAGSIDVEERNAMSRAAALSADAVLVVGRAGMKGTHSLVRTMHEVAAAGVHPARIVPVVACAPRAAGTRAELTATLAELTALPGGRPAPPVFLPERRVDDALRDGVALPAPLPATLASAVAAVLDHLPANAAFEAPAGDRPRLVRPGSFGVLADDEEDQAWGG